MSTETAKILDLALKMSVEERAALAEQLIVSLDETFKEKFDPEVELAWQKEVNRRLDDIESGKVTMMPWEEARETLRSLSRASH